MADDRAAFIRVLENGKELTSRFWSDAVGAGVCDPGELTDTLISLIEDICLDLAEFLSAPFTSECFLHSDAILHARPIALGTATATQLKRQGISFDQFFCQAKLIRRSVTNILHETLLDPSELHATGSLVCQFFDLFELAAVRTWHKQEIVDLRHLLREARHFILQEKKRYYSIFNRMAEPAFVVDREKKIFEVNRACEAFFQQSRDKLIGLGCCDLFGKAVCGHCGLERAMGEHTSFSNLEAEVTVGNEKKTILIAGTFLGDIDETHQDGGIVIFQDVTAQKEYQRQILSSANELQHHRQQLAEQVEHRTEELRQAVDRLQQEVNERRLVETELLELATTLEHSNAELEQFTHVASHDMKEPLMLISAFSERLRNLYGPVLDDRGRQYVERIIKSAGQLQKLIDDLLQLARITTNAHPFEPIELPGLFDEVLLSIEERILQSGGKVSVQAPHTLEGDRIQIWQLFQNLICNSLKYSKSEVPPEIIITSRTIGNEFCEIFVEDNGIGFDERYADRIFVPFERLHPKGEYEGTGIGLATCRKIVLRHGGQISARSVVGQGSIFTVCLPLRSHK